MRVETWLVDSTGTPMEPTDAQIEAEMDDALNGQIETHLAQQRGPWHEVAPPPDYPAMLWCIVHSSTYPAFAGGELCLYALLWKTDPALARCSRVLARIVLEPYYEGQL